jgi:nucleotide-binding universal stress UspA family protein
LTVLLPTGRPAQGPRCCGIQDAKWNEITESAFGDELARAAGLLDGSAGDVTFARVAGDSVAAAVTEYARREGCDLIALPVRGLSPGNFGRRTERVLMAAGLGPVLRLPTN